MLRFYDDTAVIKKSLNGYVIFYEDNKVNKFLVCTSPKILFAIHYGPRSDGDDGLIIFEYKSGNGMEILDFSRDRMKYGQIFA